jgi:hypothetical protein
MYSAVPPSTSDQPPVTVSEVFYVFSQTVQATSLQIHFRYMWSQEDVLTQSFRDDFMLVRTKDALNPFRPVTVSF